MLHRGATSSYIHIKSDLDPAITEGGGGTRPTNGASITRRRGLTTNPHKSAPPLQPIKTSTTTNPPIDRWSGLKSFSRHTSATHGIVPLPLETLTQPPTQPAISAGSSRRRRVEPILQVRPFGSSGGGDGAYQNYHTTATAARINRARERRLGEKMLPTSQEEKTNQMLPPSTTSASSEPFTPRQAEQRMLLMPATGTQDSETSPPRQSQQTRLTIPHLPIQLEADSSGFLSTTSTALTTSRTNVTVPDASIIFRQFQRWFLDQREERQEWQRKVDTFHAEVKRAHDEAEFKKEEARQKKLKFKEQRTLLKLIKQSSSPTASTTTPLPDESDSESEDGDDSQSIVSTDAASSTTSTSSPAPFKPALFSYPRLQFETSHGLMKFQPHLIEIQSFEEIQTIWPVIAEMMTATLETRTVPRDSIVHDRFFAFQLDQTTPTAPATTNSTDDATNQLDLEDGRANEDDAQFVSHGYDNGASLGSGEKLLHLLQQLELSNLFILVTESGGNQPSSIRGNTASYRAEHQANLVRAAKIMLQDFVRIKNLLGKVPLMHEAPSTAPSMPPTHSNNSSISSSINQSQSTALVLVPSTSDVFGSNYVDTSGWATDDDEPKPIVSLFTIPLQPAIAAPIPIPTTQPTTFMVPYSNQSALVPSSSNPDPVLPFMTPDEENILKSEFLSLLSGHAFLKMNSLNLTRNHGRNRPYFMNLWQAYLVRLHPPQERPDYERANDAHASGRNVPLNGSGKDRDDFATTASPLSLDSTLPSTQRAREGGRLASSLKPNMKTAQRIVNNLQALSHGTAGLMLDGFAADRAHLRESHALEPSKPLHDSGTRGFALRKGAGFSGEPSIRFSLAPTLLGGTNSYQASHQHPKRMRDGLTFFELEEAEAAEVAELTAQTLELSKRKTLLHTSSESAPDAKMFLELQRAKQITPSHRISSFRQLYHQLFHQVYSFKAKYFLMRLSRARLRAMMDAYPTHPPFLIRILILSIGILLNYPIIHWKGLSHLIRGEVECLQLSTFLSQDQSSWRVYLREQAHEGALPPPYSIEKLARSIFERDAMVERAQAFREQYHGLASSAAQQAGISDAEARAACEPPRDLLAHLMGMDILNMHKAQYKQVLTLFSEPTLTVTALQALPAEHATTAMILYEWILLTLRGYNVWQACQSAFQPMTTDEGHAQVTRYREHIRQIISSQQPRQPSPQGDSSSGQQHRSFSVASTSHLTPNLLSSNESRVQLNSPSLAAIRHPTPPTVSIASRGASRPGSRPTSAAGRPTSSNGQATGPLRPTSSTARPLSGRRPNGHIPLSATFNENLLTLLESERPAATGLDGMVGSWLAAAKS